MAAGAAAAAAGSVAGQFVGMAAGVRDEFSWTEVGMAALGGAVSAGLTRVGAKPGGGAARTDPVVPDAGPTAHNGIELPDFSTRTAYNDPRLVHCNRPGMDVWRG